MPDRRSKVSVVVTITNGESHICRCIEALQSQRGAAPAEIIVPVFGWEDVAGLLRCYPAVIFLPLEGERPSGPGNEHLLYDRRRSAGLAAVTGDIVAMIEDHAIPSGDWCASILHTHEQQPWAAIGGAIQDYGGRGTLNRALYYCDFGRYQHPPRGLAAHVSDVNVSYKREALERVRDVWRHMYHETWVHEALLRRGEMLWLEPGIVVRHDRGAMRPGRVLAQRFAWARLFAGRRAQSVNPVSRVALAVLSPLLPLVLVGRQFRAAAGHRRDFGLFLTALPMMSLLVVVWACGEFTGYLTAQPVGGRVLAREAY